MENIVRKGEIACNNLFLLFSVCFLPYIFHFRCTLKCCLQSGNGLTHFHTMTTFDAPEKKTFEITMGKGENVGYQLFLFIPQCFQKAFSSGSLRRGL